MIEEQRAALVALLRVARRPPHVLAELVEATGDVVGILEEELAGGPGRQAQLFPITGALQLDELLEEAAHDLELWRDQGIETLTVSDPAYPANLRRAHDRPPLIFLRGKLQKADDRGVAVIGTRTPSAAGVALGGVISTRLGTHTYTVFSGLATGIDTAAHQAALDQGARTVAVVGTGLSRAYPPENAGLQRTIAQRGAVVSQFFPDAPPSRASFPRRNALMSGLALATVIVEAGEHSGVRIQARAALAHGRPVILLAPVMGQHWARELSERPNVHVAAGADEVLALVDRLSAADVLTP